MEHVKKWNMLGVAKTLMSPLIKDLSPKDQDEQVEKLLEALNLIRINPTRMVLRKYNTDFSMPKYEWKNK
jgi:ABC-type dipeptide/oligopeptide/nickel transport system ATPase component